MKRRDFIARRILLLFPVLFGLSILTFVISHVAPGDPAASIAGINATKETIEMVRHKWGFDKPLPEQYIIYMKGLFRGDLGMSGHTQHPVWEDLKTFIPATAELALASLLFMIILGIPLGVIAANNKDGILDHLTRLGSVVGVCIPAFLLALIFQMVFYSKLGWLPAGGRLDASLTPPTTITGLYVIDSLLTANWVTLANSLKHLIMPAIVLGVSGLGGVARITRASMLEVIGSDYIKAARAKGVPERTVIGKHALKNSLIPVTTVVGLWIGALLGGTFIVEVIFYWPGIGYYGTAGILKQDFNTTIGVALFIGFVYVLANLAVDILYVFLDPRIQYG